ncbi:MAG: iron-only hydrogenase system regulator [Kiritimatiellae bacterium]|nr:iron-only hydrogenase system regulator [Kiritimatiellia bacterium]
MSDLETSAVPPNGQSAKRIGFVGIIVEHRETVSPLVNRVISEFADLILARVGLPRRDRRVSVITLVVEATTDELGALTGKLGTIAGVTVKSGLAKARSNVRVGQD